jgi:Fe2+ or Zn2+ uptake regulation protein
MSFVDQSIAVLRSKGYKVTRARRQVLRAVEAAGEPVSPYEIEKMMEERGEHLDHVTVYRVLSLLNSLNLVHKVMSKGGFVKCDLLGTAGCHRFLLCRNCGGLQEFCDEALCRQESSIAQRFGFRAEHHSTECSGLCRHCR